MAADPRSGKASSAWPPPPAGAARGGPLTAASPTSGNSLSSIITMPPAQDSRQTAQMEGTTDNTLNCALSMAAGNVLRHDALSADLLRFLSTSWSYWATMHFKCTNDLVCFEVM